MLLVQQSCSPHLDTWYWCFNLERKAFLSTIFFIIKVHLWNETNLDSHNNLRFYCGCAPQSCPPYWDTRYWCFGFAKNVFLSTIFLIIKVHPWNEINMDTHNTLHSFYCWALQLYSPHWDTWYWCFDLAEKAFFSTIFFKIKVHMWSETNLDFHNNLHSFCDWHYNHSFHIMIHDIKALVWKKKLFFFPPFSL